VEQRIDSKGRLAADSRRGWSAGDGVCTNPGQMRLSRWRQSQPSTNDRGEPPATADHRDL